VTTKRYLLSLPERILRSALGLGAGVARETATLALPDGVRNSQLYKNLVDATLRFVIEQVGGVEGVARGEAAIPDDFLARRTAGNAIELLGIVAFRASPVWILAALADVCGLGRHLIPEIADALKAEGLLDKDSQFDTVDQLLDGLERTSSGLAATINTPPLDVAGLRQEWQKIRDDAGRLKPAELPTTESVRHLWTQLKEAAEQQHQSIFQTSSVMAMSAVRAMPDGVRWISSSARVGATRTGQVFGAALLDHYRETLKELRDVGYLRYATRQLRPYLRASVRQFSPARPTLTERLVERLSKQRVRFRRIGTEGHDDRSLQQQHESTDRQHH
jgi:hypothetical protein